MSNEKSELTVILGHQAQDGRLISNFIANTLKLGANTLTRSVWEKRKELLNSYWTRFMKTNGDLVVWSGDTDFETSEYVVEDYFGKIEWAYTQAMVRIKSELSPGDNVATVLPGQGQIISATVEQHLPRETYRGLPVIKLPKFGGDIFEWPTFKEMFTSLVYNEPNIQPVNKLQYLLASLEGDAAQRVKNTSINGANLVATWNALLRKYDNKPLLFQAQLERLLSLPSVKSRNVDEIQHLLDTVEEARRVAPNFDRSVESWDDWYVGILISKLDTKTRETWETSRNNSTDFPKWDELVNFLEILLRSLNNAKKLEVKDKRPNVKHKSLRMTSTNVATEKIRRSREPCPQCQAGHILAFCDKFKRLSVSDRREQVKRLGLCFNCLRSGHSASSCQSSSCIVCAGKHNTVLHSDVATVKAQEQTESNSLSVAHTSISGRTVLFATALVIIRAANGRSMSVRALLDAASEESYISEYVAQTLRLRRRPAALSICGVGGGLSATAASEVDIIVASSIDRSFKHKTNAYILKRVTDLLPSRQVCAKSCPILAGCALADPNFDRPGKIDCILGVEVYASILREGTRIGMPGSPSAIQTVFGWVVVGAVPDCDASVDENRVSKTFVATKLETISEQIRRFWDIESVDRPPELSPEDRSVVELYEKEYTRDASGRFTVPMPLCFSEPKFPGSLDIAIRRFHSAERKFAKHDSLAQAYKKFLREYESLGHMEKAKDISTTQNSDAYFLPHHAVVKSDGSGAIRVVFNASQAASNGLSLNDTLFAGPKLQLDLWIVLLRFRFFRYAFTGDIVKMFRQIRVKESDLNRQMIVWRERSSGPLEYFRLLTVTYGTKFAPFASIWVLNKVAELERERFPIGSTLLTSNTYVDDVLGGGDTLEEAQKAQSELISILHTAGCELSKWAANVDELLPTNPQGCLTQRTLGAPTCTSTLGLGWHTGEDTFQFQIRREAELEPLTKRRLLSSSLRLFDPLGLLAPVLIRSKILIQDCWLLGVDWDEEVTKTIQEKWRRFLHDLETIQTMQIPRWLQIESRQEWHLHGFSDASERAYAATVYAVSQQTNGTWTSVLVMSKSRVAPVKCISLPRMELQGAVLLARLVSTLCAGVAHQPTRILCWSDSKVVLAWLRAHPSKWVAYVANRVAEIDRLLPDVDWRHVRSHDNPADCATRGFSAAELAASKLWWNGPPWLVQGCSSWPIEEAKVEIDVPEQRKSIALMLVRRSTWSDWLSKFSSFDRPVRVLALILHWKRLSLKRTENPPRRVILEDLRRAERVLYRSAQSEFFQEEIQAVSSGKGVSHSSKLRHHAPFLDQFGLLRVGGRLHNAYLAYEEKHPILLSRHSWLATLLVRKAHAITMHGPISLTWSYLVSFVWILGGRILVRSENLSCMRCARFAARPCSQQMATLPKARVVLERPFAETGIDYAGPFKLRLASGRGTRSQDGYVAVFVCMASRAVHLEVVTALSTEAFMAAFTRFTARRGSCSRLYSDNATNFRGASVVLRRLFRRGSEFQEDVAAKLLNKRVDWCFTPPSAPHHGGLWEAAVKIFKQHLRKVVGDTLLTYEEFATVAASIEQYMNTRPLCALSSDPADLNALTPGHLVIGSGLSVLPDPNYIDTESPRNPRTRWEMLQQMRNHFWRRWNSECLNHMQRRSKWCLETPNIHTGAMVLLIDDRLPPGRWPLARIVQVHPGSDSKVRVVTVRTAKGQYIRPISKVALLPNPVPSTPPEGESSAQTAGGAEDENQSTLKDPTSSGPDSTNSALSKIQPHAGEVSRIILFRQIVKYVASFV